MHTTPAFAYAQLSSVLISTFLSSCALVELNTLIFYVILGIDGKQNKTKERKICLSCGKPNRLDSVHFISIHFISFRFISFHVVYSVAVSDLNVNIFFFVLTFLYEMSVPSSILHLEEKVKYSMAWYGMTRYGVACHR